MNMFNEAKDKNENAIGVCSDRVGLNLLGKQQPSAQAINRLKKEKCGSVGTLGHRPLADSLDS
ncbi:hypothetical protein [Lysobacter antibioticus]|uniref:hypothetical protein n=1 Tax=Lysobacter antibioticus TaxID=84531 RepID=UPI001187673C|nr:hypothetical protein [Lysobacter antibioticus]